MDATGPVVVWWLIREKLVTIAVTSESAAHLRRFAAACDDDRHSPELMPKRLISRWANVNPLIPELLSCSIVQKPKQVLADYLLPFAQPSVSSM